MPAGRLAAAIAIAALTVGACSDSSGGSGADGTIASTVEPTATSDTTPTTSAPVDMSGVTLKVAASVENGQTLIRDRAAKFVDTPYNIEWVETSGSNATIEALNAGAVDMTPSLAPPSLLLAQANAGEPWTVDDTPLAAIAAWQHLDSPGFVIVARSDRPIDSVADLAGRKVAFAKAGVGHYFWLELSAAEGLGGSVEEVLLPAADGRSAFRAGEVDALITGERAALTLVDEGLGRIIANSADYTPYVNFTVVRDGLLDDPARAAAVADFLIRLQAEERWMAENIDVVAEVFAETMDMTLESAAIAGRSDVRTRVALGDELVATLQAMIEAFHAVGIADTIPDVTILLDLRYESQVTSTP